MYKPSWYIRSINSALNRTNTGRPHHVTHHAMEKSKLPLDASHYCIASSLQSARTWTERETVGLHWAPPSRSTKLRSGRGVRNQYTYLRILKIDTLRSVYSYLLCNHNRISPTLCDRRIWAKNRVPTHRPPESMQMDLTAKLHQFPLFLFRPSPSTLTTPNTLPLIAIVAWWDKPW